MNAVTKKMAEFNEEVDALLGIRRKLEQAIEKEQNVTEAVEETKLQLREATIKLSALSQALWSKRLIASN